mmetsp:Transcript_4492/g.6741  ORF Transcript_4492/g.6741 Transcript_4492/m.6741 type:complete len:406 (+) Transcript_4492:887-2104(+)
MRCCQSNHPIQVAKHVLNFHILLIWLLSNLLSFFHADGDGLPKQALRTQCELLEIAIKLFDKERSMSEPLISMFHQLNNEEMKEAGAAATAAARKTSIEQPPKLTAAHVLCILATRKDEHRVKQLVRQHVDKVGSRCVRTRFGLASNDRILEEFTCKSNTAKGTLTIAEHTICFSPLLWSEFGAKRIDIAGISDIRKTHSQFLRQDNALEFELLDDPQHPIVFSGFTNRDRVYTMVLEQAQQVGAPVIIRHPKDDGDSSSGSSVSSSSSSYAAAASSTTRTSDEVGFTPTTDHIEAYLGASERFKRVFKLDECVVLLAFGACHYKGSIQGEMYVCSTFVGFAGKRLGVIGKETQIPIGEIGEISRVLKTDLLIKRQPEGKEYLFARLSNIESIYQLIQQLVQRSQ